mmetsp:Transcript_80386/g.239459  ORF Transcript_80386/g.239459 Transcript_80386/m.239459 type:complete len:86 (-) Transcript_80386:136-393(-)
MGAGPAGQLEHSSAGGPAVFRSPLVTKKDYSIRRGDPTTDHSSAGGPAAFRSPRGDREGPRHPQGQAPHASAAPAVAEKSSAGGR